MKSFWQIWGAPVVLGALTIFGLLAVLLGLGVWHWLSWLSLTLPLAVIARHLWCVRMRTKQARASIY